METKAKGLTVLVIIVAVATCALAASASALPDNHSSGADTGWMGQYAPYEEITSLRDYSVKHFDMGNGERVAVVGQGLLHYYDGEKFEDIPDLPFPEGIELVDEKDEHYIMSFPDWCTARVEDEGRVVRCYDKKNTSIYEFKDLVVVAKGVSPYKKIVGSDGEEKTVIDEEKVDYCKFNVKDNKMYLVVPDNLSNTYPLQAYDDVDTSATNNKDSYLKEDGTNYGTSAALNIYATNNKRRRIVMDWTLSSETGEISAIKLFLYKYYNTGDESFDVEVHEILESPFVESEVTWNARKQEWDPEEEENVEVPWENAGCGSPTSSSSTVVDSIPRTATINEWHNWDLGPGATAPMSITWGSNFDITLRESTTFASDERERFYSKEYTDDTLRPYIEITYSPPPPPTPSAPFMIYGWVLYKDGTACDNPAVNITNPDTGAEWQAETNASYNYYQIMLANGTDLNVSEILQFSVTSPDGSQSKAFDHTVTSEEVNYGGIFNSNVTLSVPSQQTWYFTNNEASDPIYAGANYNKTMTKGAEGGNEKITLEPGERVWFYADQVAQCNVTFPAGKWNVVYWVKALNENEAGDGRVFTRIGYVDATGNGNLVSNSSSEAITNPQHSEEIVEDWFKNNDVPSFTVPEGGRLAIEVYWGSSPLGSLEIHCNPLDKHSSQVTSPSSDPGYPIPELPTLILFSSGLLILAGYVVLKRKK